MLKHTLAASMAALLATVAVAEDLSPAQQESKIRLGTQLDVDPNEYTLSQLIQMKSVVGCGYSKAETDRRLAAIKGWEPSSSAADEASKQRLASEMNVDPSEYTLDGLIQLKALLDQGEDCNIPNPQEWAKIGEDLTPNMANTKQVLAESLRVDPNEHTLAELVKMKFDREE